MITDKRINELETKASFQDQTIEDLHETIYKQQQQINHLEKIFENLKNLIRDASENDIRPNEKPPHY